MNARLFQEPELEFGNGGMHVDVRFGIMEYGPLDVGTGSEPSQLRVGIVGTLETVDGVKTWLEKARDPISAKASNRPGLFPEFPGFSETTCFHSSVVYHDRWTSVISKREIDGLLALSDPDALIENAVDLFLHSCQDFLIQGGASVLICAPPEDLLAALDALDDNHPDTSESEIDESIDSPPDRKHGKRPFFHDLLKARGMQLAVPIQMVRPGTYSSQHGRQPKLKSTPRRLRQDEATRAWNFHTALYYKAGGVPWRILRQASEYTTCYVGISFYRSTDGERLLTSIAQVFNERGEGVIVKGGVATIDKTDRQAHLSWDDSKALLKAAIQSYRREHKTSPARVVLHKTSKSNEAEVEGFHSAIRDENIGLFDLVSLRRSYTRLFRTSTYPPLRGTFLELEDKRGIIYLKGSVNFFETYPGMYVPRPLEITVESAETPLHLLAEEILSLSKLNWNNTQFDGGEPITLKAARKVGDILKHIEEERIIQPSFRFFM